MAPHQDISSFYQGVQQGSWESHGTILLDVQCGPSPRAEARLDKVTTPPPLCSPGNGGSQPGGSGSHYSEAGTGWLLQS